ncbi:hypothetical protein GPJ56_010739 [Histomonas meleagridis]|uniref:uncharacterized protein n=1 Tax=Histomonas meleagridis TaxID=135588 RepID=UPI00355A349D|nr:hypothetical protein GPJ56_010739 [Histomonas meleagridis]KAH0801075.1 hypothetical protein GO595_006110 [Histomonas meleagridis]
MEVLHYLHRTYKEQSPQIITIMNEISPIFDSLNTGSTVSEDKTFEGITPEQITTIDNNLRDLEQITDLKAHEQELEDHIHSLFQSDVSSSAISYGKEHTLDPFLTFGTLGTFPIVLNKEKEFNECKFKMLDLRESGIFHHILYSILSGRTLVIESSFIKEAEALGNRFSLLVPFFKPEHFKVTESPISLESCLPYSVVITTKFNIDLEESDRVAYLNLNKHYYRGPICSQRSLVYKTLNINEVKTEFGLVLVSLNALETFKEKIIGISNLVENVPTSLSKVSQYWDMPSSYEGDFKIFEFWVHSANNRNSGRTVLMNHKLRAGTGIVVFYPKQ